MYIHTHIISWQRRIKPEIINLHSKPNIILLPVPLHSISLSNIASLEAVDSSYIEDIDVPFHIVQYKQLLPQPI
ncbi:MAG: hypothetical protein E6767_05055 [Dysgonomonas sp.]|nr:hypothetical protein [Dysgonomonas sp.]